MSEFAGSRVRNELEVQFFGLQRSGNHGVLSWIIGQFEEPVFFFNNVEFFLDPFLHFRFAKLPNTVPVSRPPIPDGPLLQERHDRALRHLETLRGAKKKALIYSYENLTLRKLRHQELVPRHDEIIGLSGKLRRVLLLRDFYNWISSRIKLLENKLRDIPSPRGLEGLVSLWIMYAREFLGETEFLGTANVTRISYNRWVEDEGYRADLLVALGIPMKDNSNRYVPDVGGGSSFDGGAFTGRPTEMKVSERWRHLGEQKYSTVLGPILDRRGELEQLNQAIFGIAFPFQP